MYKQTASTSSSHYSGVMALSGVVRGAFLAAVLLYFTGDQSLVDGGADYSRYKDFLMENYEDWIMLVSLAFKYGVPEKLETITEYLDELRDKCQKNESCRTALNLLQRLYQKYNEKMTAMKIIAVILKLGPKLAQDIFRKTASHPIGLAADAAQIMATRKQESLLELEGTSWEGS